MSTPGSNEVKHTEAHPLLNGAEFRAEVVALGYHHHVGGFLFNNISRFAKKSQASCRTAEDIYYVETPVDKDKPEAMISIVNLAAHRDEFLATRSINTPYRSEVVKALLDKFVSSDVINSP